MSFFVSESIKDKLDEDVYSQDEKGPDSSNDSIRAVFASEFDQISFKILSIHFLNKNNFIVKILLHASDVGKIAKNAISCAAVYLSDHEIKITSSKLDSVTSTDKINEYLVDISCLAE